MTERGDKQYKAIRKSRNSSPLSVALAGASSSRGGPLFAYTASGNQALAFLPSHSGNGNDFKKVTKPQAVVRPLTFDALVPWLF